MIVPKNRMFWLLPNRRGADVGAGSKILFLRACGRPVLLGLSLGLCSTIFNRFQPFSTVFNHFYHLSLSLRHMKYCTPPR